MPVNLATEISVLVAFTTAQLINDILIMFQIVKKIQQIQTDHYY